MGASVLKDPGRLFCDFEPVGFGDRYGRTVEEKFAVPETETGDRTHRTDRLDLPVTCLCQQYTETWLFHTPSPSPATRSYPWQVNHSPTQLLVMVASQTGTDALRVHHGRGRLHRSGVDPAGFVPQQIVDLDLLGGSVRLPLGVVVIDGFARRGSRAAGTPKESPCG